MKRAWSPFQILFLFFLAAPVSDLHAQSINGSPTINKCETKTYSITIQNTTGSPLTGIEIANSITLLTGFSYVTGTTAMDVNGDGAFCSADPSVAGGNLTWNIDSLCGGSFTLNSGDTLTVSFQLRTDCQAVSGSMVSSVTCLIGGTPAMDFASHAIQVLPGGLSIKKTPGVIAGEIGQNVTWTITVGITAQVIAGTGLTSAADARWGCDMTIDCFNTATDGGTARASVQRITSPPFSSTPRPIAHLITATIPRM